MARKSRAPARAATVILAGSTPAAPWANRAPASNAPARMMRPARVDAQRTIVSRARMHRRLATAVAGAVGRASPGPARPAPVAERRAGGGGGIAPPTGFGAGQYRFPLDVPHSYGDGFGAGRGHEGQDLFAACGSPILAARGGRVQRVGCHGRAGNYVVVDGAGTGVDTMYAHLLRARRCARRAGRDRAAIGQVGSSGNASGCHLHFEIWTAPGWYEGGDPMPSRRPTAAHLGRLELSGARRRSRSPRCVAAIADRAGAARRPAPASSCARRG